MKRRQKNLLIGIILIFILICFILFFTFFLEKEKVLTKEKIYCGGETRNIDVCATIYEPVCGYSVLENCDNFNCRKAFSNSCFACIDKEVLFYSVGEC